MYPPLYIKKEIEMGHMANARDHAKGKPTKKQIERGDLVHVADSPVSTAVGQKQRMAKLKEKLLSTGNSETVLRKMIEIIKNDDHPAQGMMIKEALARMLPVSLFDDGKKDGNRTAISISISGLGDSGVVVDQEPIDG